MDDPRDDPHRHPGRRRAPAEPEWPAHPWIRLVERYGDATGLGRGGMARVTVIWWRTRSGVQPVLLVRRIRLD